MKNLKDNSYFCVLPWMHLHINTQNKVLPCCISDNGLYYEDFPDATSGDVNSVMNSEVFKKIRRDMLDNKPVKYCFQCYELEKYGNHSSRKHSNNKYLTPQLEEKIKNETAFDGEFVFDIFYFDVRFSNVCNYKCRMCGANYSTKWYEDLDYKIDGPLISIDNIKEYCNQNIEYFKNLKYVYFAGGEPLVQKQHYEFLEWCIENNLDPELYYQSNGSILNYSKFDILNLWNNFSKVTYSVSIDCFGKIGEYIRTGYQDKKVRENLNKVYNFFGSNNEIIINSTFMIYNALFITEFFDEIDLEPWVINNNVYPQLLIYPEYLQPKVLPKELKEKAIFKINNSKWYKQFPEKFEALLNNLKDESSEELWNNFIEHTKNLDKKRKENLITVIPEFEGYYE